jgi:hypothetical protein
LDPGAPVNYSIHSFSEASIAGETTIKLVLEKYIRENSTYSEIQTLFQGTHDFSTGGDFQYNSSYTPETVYPRGSYRLKLEVTAYPEGLKNSNGIYGVLQSIDEKWMMGMNIPTHKRLPPLPPNMYFQKKSKKK